MEGVGTRWKRLVALLVGSCAYGAALSACGGGSASPESSPKTAHEAASTPPDDAPSKDEAAPEAEPPPKAALCDDGTCSPCGAGVCPNGWYCDESASGGPACGWLPQCAQKSGCACLASKLGAGCKCSQQSGGPHVTCK